MNHDYLWWEEFADLVPELSLKQWLRLGREGRAPNAQRITAKGKPRFSRSDVESWLSARGLRLFEVSRPSLAPALQETFDGEWA